VKAQRTQEPTAQHTGPAIKPSLPPLAEQALKTQVMLDRAGYSPGEIDAIVGTSTKRALDAFVAHGGNASALPSDEVTMYRITDEDAAGPFTPEIPPDMMQKAGLPALNYKNLPEALGERFHSSPNLLRRLNPHARFVGGEEIQVPDVKTAASPAAQPPGGQAYQSNPPAMTVTVRRRTSDLVVTDGVGHVLMYAPVTTGSEHDPLPIGTWKVTGVEWDPPFHYNPDLFWDAGANDSEATIAPGPNNPVGVVWIDLSLPHYGLHGTPEPSRIGKTTSHGCVRLTNWDAKKLAGLVSPGTRVVFAE
jgi:lipoprotein-anchoring transpeptidase ErfK/SrfK